ncbi:hypothetical protein BJ742DRAFT_131345 [Cladochytrium replicatum]|nr:hypothetical protein BJ742DRAFT_131345 [Cladochytrium replicatum]
MASLSRDRYGFSPRSVSSPKAADALSVRSSCLSSDADARSQFSSPRSVLQTTPNIAFNPAPTSSAKCSKLKIHLHLDSAVFVAGGGISGRLEIVSGSARSLRLGEIAVEVIGTEVANDRSFNERDVFFNAKTVFQGERTPPSSAVFGPCDRGTWQAHKGKTTFPFSFSLPDDSPSSFVFQSFASLRYTVTGFAQFDYRGRLDLMTKSKEAFVVENSTAPSEPSNESETSSYLTKKLFTGGQIQLIGTILQQPIYAGTNISVVVRVKNMSPRRTQMLKLALVRKLEIRSSNTSATEVISETPFKERYESGEDRSVVLQMDIPSYMRTIKRAQLSQVTCFVRVSVVLGYLSNNIYIEVPVDIRHPSSLNPIKIDPIQLNMSPTTHRKCEPSSPTAKAGKRTSWRGRGFSLSPDRALARSSSPESPGRVLPWSDDEDDFLLGVPEGASPKGPRARYARSPPSLRTQNSVPSDSGISGLRRGPDSAITITPGPDSAKMSPRLQTDSGNPFNNDEDASGAFGDLYQPPSDRLEPPSSPIEIRAVSHPISDGVSRRSFATSRSGPPPALMGREGQNQPSVSPPLKPRPVGYKSPYSRDARPLPQLPPPF